MWPPHYRRKLPSPPHTTATFQLTIADHRVALSVDVPTGPAKPRALLPLLHEITNLVVTLAEQSEAKAGRQIACAAGCGACCRQLVPIAQTEAHEIAALVNEMPEPRRTEIRTRFTNAVAQLETAGLINDLRNTERLVGPAATAFGITYFQQHVACPFLENESCSIHPSRPLACREYLVTSNPQYCATPETEQIVGVPIGAKISRVMRRMDADARDNGAAFVPLVMALEYASTHPDNATTQTGPDLLRACIGHLTGTQASPVAANDPAPDDTAPGA
jgi:Fe-S-cluster containining protein